MSNYISKEFLEKLRKLKELDKIIDFSKTSVQLEIILLLGTSSSLNVNEMVKNLGYRRKAITDALRKLLRKGLIITENSKDGDEVFLLSDSGRSYLNQLLLTLSHQYPSNDLIRSKVRIKGNTEKLKYVINMLPTAYYIHESLLCLINTNNYEASLKTLAKIVNLSPQRLKSYLDLYTDCANRELKLFKRIYRLSMSSRLLKLLGVKKNKVEVNYKLTKRGLEIAYKLPMYIKIKKNPLLKILLLLTKSCHFKQALKRILLIIYLLLMVCIGTTLVLTPAPLNLVSIYLLLAWFYITSFLVIITFLATEINKY